jgi:hypothetical protein
MSVLFRSCALVLGAVPLRLAAAVFFQFEDEERAHVK